MITALQAEALKLQLTLRPEALHFEISNNKGQSIDQGAYIYNLQLSVLERTSEILYNNPELSLPYGSVEILFCPEYISIAPKELFDDRDLWLSSMLGSKKAEIATEAYPIESSHQILCMGIDRELRAFLARQYLTPRYLPIYHQAFDQMQREAKQRDFSVVWVSLLASGLTILVWQNNLLRFANHYAYVSPLEVESKEAEVMYYVSLVIETLNLSPAEFNLIVQAYEESEEDLAKRFT